MPLSHVTQRYARLLASIAADYEAAAASQGSPEVGAAARVRPASSVHRMGPADEAAFLVNMLDDMHIVVLQGRPLGFADGMVKDGPLLGLGCGLDTEDLSGALESAEEEAGVRELIKG